MGLILTIMLTWAIPAIAAPAPNVRPYSICFPYASKQAEGAGTTLLLTADASSVTNLNVAYWRPDGTQVTTQAYTLTSRATQVVNLNDVSGLPDGQYQVEVTSNFALLGAAHVREAGGAVGVYAPVECGQASDVAFGAFYAGNAGDPTSTLHLMNSGDTAATVSLSLTETGYIANDLTIPAHGSIRFTTDDVPASVTFPQGYGLVRVTSAAPGIHGVLANEANGATTYANALWSSTELAATDITAQSPTLTSRGYLPRIVRGVAEGSTSFSTQLLVAAPNGSATATITINPYRQDGSSAGAPMTDQIRGGSAKMYAPIYNIDSQTTASLVAGSNQSIVLQADLTPDGGAAPGVSPYSADSLVFESSVIGLVLPGMVYSADTFSLLSAQNTGSSAAQIRIDIVDAQGVAVHSSERQVPAGASMTVDVRDIAALASSFIGSAVVSSSGPVAGQVDVYSAMRTAPMESVTISGPQLITGNYAEMTAVVSPPNTSKPLTYTWETDQKVVSVNVATSARNVQSMGWPVAGLKQVKVTAANADGSISAQYTVHKAAAAAGVALGGWFQLELDNTDYPWYPRLSLDAPPGSATPGYIVAVTPLYSDESETLFGNLEEYRLQGTTALIEAKQYDELLPSLTLGQPAVLRMGYTDTGLSAEAEAGIRVLTAKNGAWIDAGETCDPASAYVRRPDQNEIEVAICALGPYAIAVSGEWTYLPLIEK
jgi:hypothetical protein